MKILTAIIWLATAVLLFNWLEKPTSFVKHGDGVGAAIGAAITFSFFAAVMTYGVCFADNWRGKMLFDGLVVLAYVALVFCILHS